jgi:hypothetical protein
MYVHVESLAQQHCSGQHRVRLSPDATANSLHLWSWLLLLLHASPALDVCQHVGTMLAHIT